MKKFIKMLVVSVIIVGLIIGAIGIIGFMVNWLCNDIGRYVLGMEILGYIIYKLLRKEFDQ